VFLGRTETHTGLQCGCDWFRCVVLMVKRVGKVVRWRAYHTSALHVCSGHAMLALAGAVDGGSQLLSLYMRMQYLRRVCCTYYIEVLLSRTFLCKSRHPSGMLRARLYVACQQAATWTVMLHIKRCSPSMCVLGCFWPSTVLLSAVDHRRNCASPLMYARIMIIFTCRCVGDKGACQQNGLLILLHNCQ
jgi:hypothetical protein